MDTRDNPSSSGSQPGSFLREHQRQLIQLQRCPRCAERVPAKRILEGDQCPRCKVRLKLDESSDHAREVLTAIRAGWEQSRVIVYTAILVATFLTGFLPMAAAIATTIAMSIGNVLLIRRPLQWLPINRRLWTWLRVDVWFVALTFSSFVVHAIAATLILAGGTGALLSAVTGFLTTMLYIEGSLSLIATEVENASRNAMRAPADA